VCGPRVGTKIGGRRVRPFSRARNSSQGRRDAELRKAVHAADRAGCANPGPARDRRPDLAAREAAAGVPGSTGRHRHGVAMGGSHGRPRAVHFCSRRQSGPATVVIWEPRYDQRALHRAARDASCVSLGCRSAATTRATRPGLRPGVLTSKLYLRSCSQASCMN
jgi:hypothetical protein